MCKCVTALTVEAQECEGFSGESGRHLEGLSSGGGEAEDGGQRAHAAVGEMLPFRQVVLQRLLVTFGMLILLAAGIVCSILVPPLLK